MRGYITASLTPPFSFASLLISEMTAHKQVSLPAPLPFLPALRASACLSHSLALVDGRPLSVKITFDKLILRPRGIRGARALELPSPLSLLPGGVQVLSA